MEKPNLVSKTLVIAFLATVTAAFAQGKDWNYYGDAEDGTKYQTRDVRQSGETVQFWLKSVNPPSPACGGNPNPFLRSPYQQVECDASKAGPREVVERFEINCGSWRSRSGGGASYNSAGAVVRSLPATTWTLILPDSIADGLASKFCPAATPKSGK